MTDYTLVGKRKRLHDAVHRAEVSYELAIQRSIRANTRAPVRHKCFVTYHGEDIDEVTTFVEDFGDVFIPRVVGVSESDLFSEPINSTDEDYVKKRIRERYLTDSTVTIVFVGKHAWSRKYIDWEISSSLRNDTANKRNGLMAITPASKSENKLPARFSDNWRGNDDPTSYARYFFYPTNEATLRARIEDAFDARMSRSSLVDNSRKLRTNDSSC
jgi:hypothetical protein